MHLATKQRQKHSEADAIKLSVDEWIDVPDNPRQRPTEEHARKALRGHLSQLKPSHSVVHAATQDGEILCKIDGHTRAYLWNNGQLERPDELLCVCIEVKDLNEAAEVYTHFDSPNAVESVSDKVGGALRECGVTLSSPLLRNRRFISAIQIAAGCYAGMRNRLEYKLVADWIDELKTLDSWDLGAMASPLVGLALALIRAGYGDQARRFFQAYCGKAGIKTEEGCDGVMALDLHIRDRQAKSLMTGSDNLYDIFGRGLTCFNAFNEGRMLNGGVKFTKRGGLDARIERRMASVAK